MVAVYSLEMISGSRQESISRETIMSAVTDKPLTTHQSSKFCVNTAALTGALLLVLTSILFYGPVIFFILDR
jgi:hypothetical protein